MTVSTSYLLKVCHQNIRGLVGKTHELLGSLLFDPPHTICLTEHHLKEYEINNISMDNYELGAKYCRITYKNGGVCIFIHNSIKFNNVLIEKYCVEKDIEACAIKLILTNIKIIVLAVYRSPSGNFNKFLQKLDNILRILHNNKSEFIICGDVNINYLEKCDRRQQLDALLSTYNLIGTVSFPTRIVKDSRTAIDNIYIHKTRNYTINPVIRCFPTWGPRPTGGQFDCYGGQFENGLVVLCICYIGSIRILERLSWGMAQKRLGNTAVINGLSDHDAQMISVGDIMLPGQVCSPQYIRSYSNYNISKFQELLSYE
jgi:exonuclease III